MTLLLTKKKFVNYQQSKKLFRKRMERVIIFEKKIIVIYIIIRSCLAIFNLYNLDWLVIYHHMISINYDMLINYKALKADLYYYVIN